MNISDPELAETALTSLLFTNLPEAGSPVHLTVEERMACCAGVCACVFHVFGSMRGALAAVSQLVKDRLPQSTVEALLWVTLTMSSSAEVSGQ